MANTIQSGSSQKVKVFIIDRGQLVNEPIHELFGSTDFKEYYKKKPPSIAFNKITGRKEHFLNKVNQGLNINSGALGLES